MRVYTIVDMLWGVVNEFVDNLGGLFLMISCHFGNVRP